MSPEDFLRICNMFGVISNNDRDDLVFISRLEADKSGMSGG